jgi:RHS repeat-associated protein
MEKFTGKERDSESGLAYFGARYYGSALGRFTSPDSLVDQHPANPQSWNLYAYVRNNPLAAIDPTGNYDCGSTMNSKQCDQFQSILDKAQTEAYKLRDTYGADSQQYLDTQRAIDSYGLQNDQNGVVVNIGSTPNGVAGTTAAYIPESAPDSSYQSPNPTGQNIQVVINQNIFNSGKADLLSQVVAHEGSHVGDAEDWAKSGFNDSPTNFATEFRAYGVTAAIAVAQGSRMLFGSRGGPLSLFFMKGAQPELNKAWRANMVRALYPNSEQKAFNANTESGGPSH